MLFIENPTDVIRSMFLPGEEDTEKKANLFDELPFNKDLPKLTAKVRI